MNNIVKDAVKLFLITLIAGVALGFVHELTLEPIAKAQQEAANTTYREVFPEMASVSETDELNALVESVQAETANWGYGKVSIDGCMEALDASGNRLGYIINASSKEGYGGTVQISTGIDTEGKLTGLGFLTINETPGLGMRAKDAAFRDQFAGKDASGELALVKTGGANEKQIDAIGGASYTSGAVTNALNAAIHFVNNYLG
jgi:electron transport complex protein RnfG